MRKNTVFALLMLSLLAFVNVAGAASSVPAEVKSFMLKFLDAYGNAVDVLARDVSKTEDPSKMAAALVRYADTLEPLMAKMAELEQKYENFFDSRDDDEKTGDAEMDLATDVFVKKMSGMMTAMQKIAANMENPDVAEAMDRLENIMSAFDK